MKEKEFFEREYYINRRGEIFDNSLNPNLEDIRLETSEERIKEIHGSQDREINEVLED